MGELAPSNFDVNPSPLETQGGEVVATIHGKFPPKYLKKKAVVSVIPELHYGNGQVARSEGATFMGEKVLGKPVLVTSLAASTPSSLSSSMCPRCSRANCSWPSMHA